MGTVNKVTRRLALLVVVMLVALRLAGCNRNTQTLVEPAPDRPTFVWIFSDP